MKEIKKKRNSVEDFTNVDLEKDKVICCGILVENVLHSFMEYLSNNAKMYYILFWCIYLTL